MVNIITGLDRPDDRKVAQHVTNLVNPHFGFDITDRISVRADMNQYNADVDEGVWHQGKGRRAHYYECYWDNVWVCDFTDNMRGKEFLYKFLVGWKEAYENDEVSLHEPSELANLLVEDAVKTAEKQIDKKAKEVRNRRAATEEERLSNEVVAKMLEDKKIKKGK